MIKHWSLWENTRRETGKKIKSSDKETTNQAKTKLQDQFPGEPPSTFFQLLLQVCAKPVNNHEPIPGGDKEYMFSSLVISKMIQLQVYLH